MLSLTQPSSNRFARVRLASCQRVFTAAASGLLLLVFEQPLRAASFALYGDPNFSFGTTTASVGSMSAAIQTRMNIPVSVVTGLSDENTAFAPVLANSQAPPNFIFGPSANGVIKNLNLNDPILTGLTKGELRSAGSEVDICGDFAERFVLRVFSTTEFFDVLVRPATCSGISNVVWSFYEISSARPISSLTPTPTPNPFPVQLVSTASRFEHGAAGTFDVNLPLNGPPGVECRRTMGEPGSYTMVFTFRRPLNSVSSASITSGIANIDDSGIGFDPREYIVNLINVANAQNITVTLNFVQDSEGNTGDAVDGEMSILIGDTGDNGNVGSADVSEVKAQLGQPVTAMNFRDDLNHDGVIDGNDVDIVKRQKKTSLPKTPRPKKR